ncbi:MAG: tetratricopeptide repeat protein [Gammaproteobacteria bacterium]|nr:tetratricopeptide repeat protein [Gammaproteobacteria bacterium]
MQILGLLAELYVAAGSPDQGVSMLEATAQGYEGSLGTAHAYTINARYNHVAELESVGRYEEAIVAALDLCGDVAGDWGKYHGNHVTCLELLGGLQMTTGQLGEAEKTYLKISDIMGKSLPRVDTGALSNLSQLGEIYRRQGRYDESQRVLSGVIQLALQVGNLDAANKAKLITSAGFSTIRGSWRRRLR